MSAKPIKSTIKSKTNWEKISRASDSDIDYSDNPATTEEFWEDAKLFAPSHKIHISLRLDEEVVEFFKNMGSGYQTRINAALKAYVVAHKKGIHRRRNG